jgi:outer membrane biosynthesis protein TonB
LVVRAAEPAPAPLAATAPSPSATPTSTEASRASTNSLDTLLDSALSPEARRAELNHTEAPPSAAALAPTPSTQDIARALGSVQFAIRGCAMGQTGAVTAALSIRSDGRVTSAQIIGAPFAGTPAGRCMEGALRSAHFTPFKQAIFSVRYPLSVD